MAITWGEFKKKVDAVASDNDEIDVIDTGVFPDDIDVHVSPSMRVASQDITIYSA